MGKGIEWTAEKETLLKALIVEGLSSSEIGKKLGLTKNAVLGKAHRMRLTFGGTSDPYRKRQGKFQVQSGNFNVVRTCQWLHGDPKDRNFCGQKTRHGSSWCDEHKKIVFARKDEGDE